jgi:CRP-like cAMP-binding protein
MEKKLKYQMIYHKKNHSGPPTCFFRKDADMSTEESMLDLPFFQNFSEQEKKMFSEMKYSTLGYKKGDLIIQEGDADRSIFLLLTGSCLITKNEEGANIRLAKIGPGEVFGEMSRFSNRPRRSNVVANEDVLALKMGKDFFEKVTPELGNKIKDYLIDLLCRRLDTMNQAIMRISKLMRTP